VFSQDEPPYIIWGIAGGTVTVLVGDKNEDFMKGKVDTLTT
jgi:hypothetical protein